MNILHKMIETNNETVILICLILAVFRVYLEVIRFNFNELPITKLLSDRLGRTYGANIHRFGLILSVGYILLFSPYYILN